MPDSYLKKLARIRPDNYLIQLENARRIFPKADQNYGEIQRLFFIKLITRFIEKDKVFTN